MNRATSLLLATVLIANSCSEPTPTPNTDVGLVVWTEVTPATLRLSDTSAPITIRLYVLNPSDTAIRVRSGAPPYTFTRDPANSRGLRGSIRIATDSNALNAGPSIDWWGDTVYVFPAHDNRYNEWTTTLKDWSNGGWTLAPGTYRIRGWFNAREGSSSNLFISR